MKLNNFFLTSLVSALRLTSTRNNHILNCFSRVFFHYVVAVHVHFFLPNIYQNHIILVVRQLNLVMQKLFFSKEGKYLLMKV